MCRLIKDVLRSETVLYVESYSKSSLLWGHLAFKQAPTSTFFSLPQNTTISISFMPV